MPAAEFSSMSMADLALCQEFAAERRKREDMRFGVLCAMVGNVVGGKSTGGPFEPGDFFGSLAPPLPTPEQLACKFDIAFGAFVHSASPPGPAGAGST